MDARQLSGSPSTNCVASRTVLKYNPGDMQRARLLLKSVCLLTPLSCAAAGVALCTAMTLASLACDSSPAGKATTEPGAAATADAPSAASAVGTPAFDLAGPFDLSLLFVGNSHTFMHDLPNLVRRMIEFRRPGARVLAFAVCVGHLDDVANDPSAGRALAARPWTHVILQAQKISTSGRYTYSRQEGIDFARRARLTGAAVVFFSEWGLEGKPGDGQRNERIYREMADAANATPLTVPGKAARIAGAASQPAGSSPVRVAPVGRAWDLALNRHPGLRLYASDGNHQSDVGAFLTACVLYAIITGDSPEMLEAFEYAAAEATTRSQLCDAAADVAIQEKSSFIRE